MDDYIKRNVAINAIANAIIQGESLGMSIAEDILYDVPSEDVQPVRHGHWTLQEDRTKKLYGWHICSECGAWIGEPTDYCSNCGADMRGESK